MAQYPGMTVARLAISLEAGLARAVRRAAGKQPRLWRRHGAMGVVRRSSRPRSRIARSRRSIRSPVPWVSSAGARTDDVCDANVAIVASRRGDVLYTSDPLDMRRLLRALDSDVAVIAC